jgi:hypothetical protein
MNERSEFIESHTPQNPSAVCGRMVSRVYQPHLADCVSDRCLNAATHPDDHLAIWGDHPDSR